MDLLAGFKPMQTASTEMVSRKALDKVTQMPSICGTASRVVVWLRPGNQIWQECGFNAGTNGLPCLSQCLFFGEADNPRIGLCPHIAQPGDVVVMLHGGPVLHMLSKKGPPEQNESEPQGREVQWYWLVNIT